GRSRPKKQKLFYWYDYSQYYSRYSSIIGIIVAFKL
ncbi:hypothetical protein, partial [uncultured Gammaproteobacteria bacterium]